MLCSNALSLRLKCEREVPRRQRGVWLMLPLRQWREELQGLEYPPIVFLPYLVNSFGGWVGGIL